MRSYLLNRRGNYHLECVFRLIYPRLFQRLSLKVTENQRYESSQTCRTSLYSSLHSARYTLCGLLDIHFAILPTGAM